MPRRLLALLAIAAVACACGAPSSSGSQGAPTTPAEPSRQHRAGRPHAWAKRRSRTSRAPTCAHRRRQSRGQRHDQPVRAFASRPQGRSPRANAWARVSMATRCGQRPGCTRHRRHRPGPAGAPVREPRPPDGASGDRRCGRGVAGPPRGARLRSLSGSPSTRGCGAHSLRSPSRAMPPTPSRASSSPAPGFRRRSRHRHPRGAVGRTTAWTSWLEGKSGAGGVQFGAPHVAGPMTGASARAGRGAGPGTGSCSRPAPGVAGPGQPEDRPPAKNRSRSRASSISTRTWAASRLHRHQRHPPDVKRRI